MALNLITGGAGFVGCNLARELLARGEKVRILDNFSTGHRRNLEKLNGAEIMEGDILNPQTCAQACEGVEFVFHQAALPSVPRSIKDPVASHHACATGTVNLLWAALKTGVHRVVYAGSSSAYGDTPTLPKVETISPSPRSPYAVAKLAGEHYCRAFFLSHGPETVTLRYFNVFGPHQDPGSPYSGVLSVFITRLIRGESCTINGDGETSRDFTYIDNVVAANLLARTADEAPGNVYNIGSGRRVTLNWVYEFLAGELGVKLPPQYGPERPGDVKHSLADITAARRDLKYEPTVDVETGLRKTIEWYREGESECSHQADPVPCELPDNLRGRVPAQISLARQ
jgi:UDP-N-acetylglucosamine/UDP-N-acetyl-alpha-D-glucosaminouronate 4-epimerase